MERIDVILSWPRTCDYPLWRQFIRNERHRFSNIYAVLTEHHGPQDYGDWLRVNCPEIEFIDSPVRGSRDWRDVAVNEALDISKAERVWFTEQDFFITDPALWNISGPVIGFDAGDSRSLHPACIFADRDLIERTSRYFGTDPVDHFYTFGHELCKLIEPILLTDGFHHMQGITQNHALFDRGEQEGRFKWSEFQRYIARCLAVCVPLEPNWITSAKRIIG